MPRKKDKFFLISLNSLLLLLFLTLKDPILKIGSQTVGNTYTQNTNYITYYNVITNIFRHVIQLHTK